MELSGAVAGTSGITVNARRRKIPKDQIFLGGEDEIAYIANFTEALRAKG